jgi:hypothetical protein
MKGMQQEMEEGGRPDDVPATDSRASRSRNRVFARNPVL